VKDSLNNRRRTLQRLVDDVKKRILRGNSILVQQSLKNAGWNSVEFMALPLLWLFATPFFVKNLGVERYGIWMLVNVFLGFSGMMSFGLGDATIKYVSKYRALNDAKGVARVIRSTLTVYLLLGAMGCLVSFFGAPLLVTRVFRVQAQNIELATACIRIAGFGVAVRLIDGVLSAIFQGFERYDLAAMMSVPTNIATVLADVVMVLAGLGVEGIVAGTIVVIALSAIIKAVVIRQRIIPSLKLVPIFDKMALGEIFGFGIYSWLQGVGRILLNEVDQLLIASLVSTGALTYYTVCLQLAQQIHAFLAKAVSFLFPLASVIHERGETERLNRIYFKALRFVTTGGVALGVPMFIFAKNILTIWMGAAFASQSAALLQILAFSFSILATSIVPYYYLNGAGYVRINTAFSLLSGVLVAGANVLLIPPLGILGACWARLANTPTGLVSRTIVHYKVLNDKRWYVSLLILSPVVLTYCGSLLITVFVNIPTFGVALLLPALCGVGVLAGAVAYLLCAFTGNPASSTVPVLRSPGVSPINK